jgi:hypothetical protein
VLAQQKWYPLLYDPGGWIDHISKQAHVISMMERYSSNANELLAKASQLPLYLSQVTDSQKNI